MLYILQDSRSETQHKLYPSYIKTQSLAAI